MRPKTFPATTYSGNSRQRLQEIREGLKQPSKSAVQVLSVGPNGDTSLDAKVLGSKDASRQQQQMRATPKFGPYQKALREIRYSLLPFANESGTSTAAEVNRQMLQELVNAGCDQSCAALPAAGVLSVYFVYPKASHAVHAWEDEVFSSYLVQFAGDIFVKAEAFTLVVRHWNRC
ncbi:Serine/threonine-protein kinase LATS2 [Tupaia chinensis]|uniref:Serine/threonine-protein kinase LATS2 n=1 Tax=Tupaia chinensis TaxID=246437 RepID=L9JF33_TUPCH|nr:Serine/threonine-protein kinase LATS2 [Tupaia chinensis]